MFAVGAIAQTRPTEFKNHSKLSPIKSTDTMKQATLKFPVNQAKTVAKFLAEHSIITNLSWAQARDGFFGGVDCYAIICFPDDKEDKVKANLQKFIVEN